MNIKETVRDTVCAELGIFGPEFVPMHRRFIEDLQADSLDMVSLVMALEEELDIDIPDEAAVKFKTPQDIVTYLEGVVDND